MPTHHTRPSRAGWLIALGLTLLLGLLAPSAPVSAQTNTAGPADPVLVALQQVFGDVSVTTTTGGAPHSGREPDEWANFAGTARGDRGVLYRTDQNNCPPDANYAPPCSTQNTWVWDGRAHTWTELPGATQPGGRMAASSAATASGQGGQAWIYSGNDHQAASTVSPYDAKAFVFGDDEQWSPAACNPNCAVTEIDGSVGAASATDSLLFGGDYAGGGPTPPFFTNGYMNTVFRWNGSDFEPLAVAGTPPPARAAAGFAFDGVDFILFGGGYASVPTAQFPTGIGDFADTWRLHKDGAGTWSWQQVCDQCGPVGRHQTTLVGLHRPNDARHGAVLIGGQAFGEFERERALSDIWAWNGTTWTSIAPGGTPCDVSVPEAPCWSDPTIPFAPFSASLPALGAAVWTTGSCTATLPPGPVVPQPSLRQVCTRTTTQVALIDAPPVTPATTPATTTATVLATLPVTGTGATTDALTLLGATLVAIGIVLVATARRRINGGEPAPHEPDVRRTR